MGKTTARRCRDPEEAREPFFLRYLRDRGCGDRWDRSTSHRRAVTESRTRTVVSLSLSHETHYRGPSLVTSPITELPGIPGTRRAILARMLIDAILAEARPADGRDLRLRALRRVLHRRLSVSEDFHSRILGTSRTPERAITVTHRSTEIVRSMPRGAASKEKQRGTLPYHCACTLNKRPSRFTVSHGSYESP